MDRDLKKAQDKIADLLDEDGEIGVEEEAKEAEESNVAEPLTQAESRDSSVGELRSSDSSHSQSYYLQVVKEGQEPEFPEGDLVVGNQWLEKGYVQHWAYPAESGLAADEVPSAEKLAREYQADKPGILINQQEDGLLELILTNNGHAWARTESDLKNLNDNVSEMLDFAQSKFKMKVEGYMTTDNTPSEVERTLEDLDNEEESKNPKESKEAEESNVAEPLEPSAEELRSSESPKTMPLHSRPVRDSFDSFEEVEKEPVTPSMHPEDTTISTMGSSGYRSRVEGDQPAIRSVFAPQQTPPHMPHLYTSPRRSSSKKGWVVIAIALLALGGVGYAFKGQFQPLLGGLIGTTPSPSPSPVAVASPVPSPTPEPTVERSSYKIRVLNGTTKSGAAGVLGDSLKALGWKVEKTGNATNSATPKSYIRTKNGLDNVMFVLGKDSGLTPASSSALKVNDTVDAELVIGKE